MDDDTSQNDDLTTQEIQECQEIVFGKSSTFHHSTATHGPKRAPLDSSCSLFEAIWTYLGFWTLSVSERNAERNLKYRHLIRFRRAFISEHPQLSEVTPNIISAYLGGPGGTQSQSQIHAEILGDFVAWCVKWDLLDAAVWNVELFHPHHPVFGEDRWYKRNKRSPEPKMGQNP